MTPFPLLAWCLAALSVMGCSESPAPPPAQSGGEADEPTHVAEQTPDVRNEASGDTVALAPSDGPPTDPADTAQQGANVNAPVDGPDDADAGASLGRVEAASGNAVDGANPRARTSPPRGHAHSTVTSIRVPDCIRSCVASSPLRELSESAAREDCARTCRQ
ncbi:MAG: hypothetical protein H6726_03290 [Sandaracinaceae bacterium]|nr:hypothetical protein [Sandaracinaceae bacterium]